MGDPNTPKNPEDEQMIPQTSEEIPDNTSVDDNQVSEDEILRRIQLEARVKVEEIRADFLSQSPENPGLKKSPEQLFEETIRPRIHEIVMAWGLAPVIEECMAMLAGSNDRNRHKLERKAAEKLMKAFSKKKLPFNKWAFFPDAMIGEKAANCSAAALVFGVIMNEDLRIKTDYANPMGHAANVVTFSDGKTYYYDPRNQDSQKIKLGTPRTRDGFDIYKVRVFDFSLLPISKLKYGAMLTILGNICELKKGKDPEAQDVVRKYGDGIDFELAEQKIKNNFLDERDDEDEWLAEKENIRYNRMLFDNFHLIPNH